MSETNTYHRECTVDECKSLWNSCRLRDKSCLLCKYFYPGYPAEMVVAEKAGCEQVLHVDFEGRCRCNPPSPDMTINEAGVAEATGVWPVVDYFMWCGKFERDDARGVEFMTGG